MMWHGILVDGCDLKCHLVLYHVVFKDARAWQDMFCAKRPRKVAHLCPLKSANSIPSSHPHASLPWLYKPARETWRVCVVMEGDLMRIYACVCMNGVRRNLLFGNAAWLLMPFSTHWLCVFEFVVLLALCLRMISSLGTITGRRLGELYSAVSVLSPVYVTCWLGSMHGVVLSQFVRACQALCHTLGAFGYGLPMRVPWAWTGSPAMPG